MIIETRIREKLTEQFEPQHLEVVNESHKHNVPQGSESHFKVMMVSAAFEGKPSVGRHRLVNKVLQEELDGEVHALSLKLLTPNQWNEAAQQVTHQTPDCAHK